MLKKDTTQDYALDLIELSRAMIYKIPEHLHNHATTFADMILKAINIPTTKKNIIESAMQLIRTMIDKYRNVVYNKLAELFVVGSAEGQIIVYSLKQYQKLKVLELHKGNVSALAFNEDGTKIVSYCDTERTLGICEINTGILAFIGINGKSSTISIDNCDNRVRLKVSGNKCGMYPKVEFGQNDKQIILQISANEAYCFTY